MNKLIGKSPLGLGEIEQYIPYSMDIKLRYRLAVGQNIKNKINVKIGQNGQQEESFGELFKKKLDAAKSKVEEVDQEVDKEDYMTEDELDKEIQKIIDESKTLGKSKSVTQAAVNMALLEFYDKYDRRAVLKMLKISPSNFVDMIVEQKIKLEQMGGEEFDGYRQGKKELSHMLDMLDMIINKKGYWDDTGNEIINEFKILLGTDKRVFMFDRIINSQEQVEEQIDIAEMFENISNGIIKEKYYDLINHFFVMLNHEYDLQSEFEMMEKYGFGELMK